MRPLAAERSCWGTDRQGCWGPGEIEDSRAFALGVLWVRAAEGFLSDFVTGDIDRAREKLDFVAA